MHMSCKASGSKVSSCCEPGMALCVMVSMSNQAPHQLTGGGLRLGSTGWSCLLAMQIRGACQHPHDPGALFAVAVHPGGCKAPGVHSCQ